MNLLIPEAKNPELNMRCDSFFVCVLLPLISFLELLSATVSHTAMCVAILFFYRNTRQSSYFFFFLHVYLES